MHLLDQNFCENNVCLTKFRSKHSSNTVRNLIKQTLHTKKINQSRQMDKA